MDNNGKHNMNGDASQCPFLSGDQKKTAGRGTSNRDWWPNELKLNIGKVIKDIPKETYKKLLIGSYKRDVVYVKKPTRKSSKKSKTYKE